MQNRIDPIVPAGTPGTVTLPLTSHTLSIPRLDLKESWVGFLTRVQAQAGGDRDGIITAAAVGENFGGDPDATGDNWPAVADYAFNAPQYARALGLTGTSDAWNVVNQRIAAGAPGVVPTVTPDTPLTWEEVYARIGAAAAGNPAQAPSSTATPPVQVAAGAASFDFGPLKRGAQTHDFPTTDADTVVCSCKLPSADNPAGNLPNIEAVELTAGGLHQRRAWLNTTGKPGDGFEVPPGSSVGSGFMVGNSDPGAYMGYAYPRFAPGATLYFVIQTQGGDPANPQPAGLHVTLAGWAGM